MLHNVLINSKWLKEFSVIPVNYCTKEIENFIEIAQQIWIVPIVGLEWYEELLEQVKNDTLTPENSTALIEAIYPLLSMAVVYESLPSLLYHVSEVSITKGHSDNSEALDLKEAGFYEQWIRRQLEVRKDFCIDWLDAHHESFPLYIPKKCCKDSCCDISGLNDPNPNYQIWSTIRKNTDLK